MNRRSFFAGAGLHMTAALAGCTAFGGGAGDSPTMALSLVSVDDDPEPLSFEIETVDDQLSANEVPTLEIEVENTGDQTATWVQSESDFAFPQRYVGEGLEIGLKEEIEARVVDGDGCTRTERRIDRTDVEVETELEPGDSIEQWYAIVGVDDELDETCPEPNTYRTEWEYGTHGEWGFEFDLENR